MKEHWNVTKEKLVSLEAGTSSNEENSTKKIAESNGICKQLTGCMKLILCIELILFFGWACYTIWQPYQTQQTEFKASDFEQNPQSQSAHSENTMQGRKNVQEDSRLFDETEDILAKYNDALQKELDLQKLRSTNHIMHSAQSEPITSISATDKPSLGNALTQENLDDMQLVSENSVEKTSSEQIETSESEENSFEPSSQEEDVMVWSFPFLWTIHGLKMTDDVDVSNDDSKQLLNNLEITNESKQFESSETNTSNKGQDDLSEDMSKIIDMVDQDQNESTEDENSFEHSVEVSTETADEVNHAKLKSHWLNWLELPKPFEVEENKHSSTLHPWFDTSLSTLEAPKDFNFRQFSDQSFKQPIPTSLPTLKEAEQALSTLEAPKDFNFRQFSDRSFKQPVPTSLPTLKEAEQALPTLEAPKDFNFRQFSDRSFKQPVPTSYPTLKEAEQRLRNIQRLSLLRDWFNLPHYSDTNEGEMLHELFSDVIERLVKESDNESTKTDVNENSNLETDAVHRSLSNGAQEEKMFIDNKEHMRDIDKGVQDDFDVRDPSEENLNNKQVTEDSAIPGRLEDIRNEGHKYIKENREQITNVSDLSRDFQENPQITKVEEVLEEMHIPITIPTETLSDKESIAFVVQKMLQLQDDILIQILNIVSENNDNMDEHPDRLYRNMRLSDYDDFLHRGIRSINNNQRNEENISNTLPEHDKPVNLLRKSIREKEALLEQRFATAKDLERRTLESNTNNFYSKMEILKEHIDRLHRRYLLLRKLDDDYISREFPPESLET